MQIELKGLVKSFKDKTAVDIDSLHIADGEMVGLVGNNGAGKTTLFRLMLDLLKADNGYVELTFATDDANPNDTLTVNPAMLEDWKQYTGAYIDSGFLIEFLTPEEYFDFIAKVSNISKEQLDTRLDKYAQFMGGEIMGPKKADSRLLGRQQAEDWHRGSADKPAATAHLGRAVQLPRPEQSEHSEAATHQLQQPSRRHHTAVKPQSATHGRGFVAHCAA